MRLQDSNLQKAFDANANTSGDAAIWAPAHNVAFEERVGSTRQIVYEQNLNANDLKGSHKAYVRNHIRTKSSATFSADNSKAFIPESDHPAELLRIEHVTRAIRKIYGSPDYDACDQLNADIRDFQDPENTSPRPEIRLERFIQRLHADRDDRPVFAAPLTTEAAQLARQDDWEQRIFELGIPLLPRDYPERFIVLMVRYTAADVYDRVLAEANSHFTAPTAIDDDFFKGFFPSPETQSNPMHHWGAAMDLDNTTASGTAPNGEVLHPPFRFAPEHLVSARCLDLTSPPAIEHAPRDVRNAHLDRVRNATGRHTFGWQC